MKLKILFVDDEQNIINGLKRMLHFMKDEWQMYFALSGNEALKILNESEMDIIVTDMRMPGMDGAALLEKVKELFPPMIRIVLSGYSDIEMVLRASQSAHQFLAKPIDAQILRKTIEQVYSLQSILHNKAIIRLANGVKNLPSLPKLYMLIEEETKKPNPSIKKIDEIISRDITMTAKILQLVNSAFFGLPQRIINPLQAINFLGIEVIKALVLMVHFFSPDPSEGNIHEHIIKLWDESMNLAGLAKKIAQIEKFEPKICEEVFIGALLHDIGKLVLWQVAGYFTDVKKKEEELSISVTEAEYQLYETSHAEIGAYLLGIWGLPEQLIKIVLYHHKPSLLQSVLLSPLTIIHICDHLISNEKIDGAYVEDPLINSFIHKWKKIYIEEQ
jgi:Predicted signal transduction protein